MARQWVQVASTHHTKWFRVYRPHTPSPFQHYIAVDWGNWFWITVCSMKTVDGDIGPFDSIEAAAACVEIMDGMQ
jgi:hypothetical protein